MKPIPENRHAKTFALAAAATAAILMTSCAGAAPPAEQTYPILKKVVVMADLVRGSKNPLGATCAYESQFARGEEIVPRVKVLDPKTEQFLTDKELKSVTFFLKDGTTSALHYGGHPGGTAPKTDFFWTVGWLVPDNFPTGAIGWWVQVETNDGRTGRYDPPVVASNALTVLERPPK